MALLTHSCSNPNGSPAPPPRSLAWRIKGERRAFWCCQPWAECSGPGVCQEKTHPLSHRVSGSGRGLSPAPARYVAWLSLCLGALYIPGGQTEVCLHTAISLKIYLQAAPFLSNFSSPPPNP